MKQLSAQAIPMWLCGQDYLMLYLLNYRMNVDHEIKLLVQEIKRLGSPNADGNVSVKFGILFSDDRCANLFEGTVCFDCISCTQCSNFATKSGKSCGLMVHHCLIVFSSCGDTKSCQEKKNCAV